LRGLKLTTFAKTQRLSEFRGGKDEDKDEKVRPFVCCKIIDEDWCFWTPLTYEYKLERLKLERSWIENSEKFKNAYLNDGNHLYSGLKSSFVVLGKSSDTIYCNRPFVNSIGLIILRTVLKRHNPEVTKLLIR
jgi:hypothetical protein